MTPQPPKPPSSPNKGQPSRKFGPKLLLGSAMVAALIGGFEAGKRADGSAVVYADRVAHGLPTVCHGLTRYITTTPIIIGELWPAEKCLVEEQKAIIKIQLRLEQCFRHLPAQQVFDSATSHAWNNGVESTCNSGAMKAWNAQDWWVGCRRIAFADSGKRVWSYVKQRDGSYKFVKGLANRRDVEYKYCMTGVLK